MLKARENYYKGLWSLFFFLHLSQFLHLPQTKADRFQPRVSNNTLGYVACNQPVNIMLDPQVRLPMAPHISCHEALRWQKKQLKFLASDTCSSPVPGAICSSSDLVWVEEEIGGKKGLKAASAGFKRFSFEQAWTPTSGVLQEQAKGLLELPGPFF